MGYGFDSVAGNLTAIHDLEAKTAGMDEDAAKSERSLILRGIDETGLITTPNNSASNEALMEAARKSILDGGTFVEV